MDYKFKIEDSAKFSKFLKKFSVIESNLLLTIRKDKMVAVTHTPEKSVAKRVSALFSDVFSEVPTNLPDIIKIGIFQIDKLSQAFSFFGGSEFSFIIKTEKVGDDEVGVSITLQNSSLEIIFRSASLSLFTYIHDDMFSQISESGDAIAHFTLGKEHQSKINSLFGIDNDYSKLTFVAKNGELRAKGKNFNYLIDGGIDKNISHETSIFKHHYIFIDREDSEIYMNEDKLVIVSGETETRIVIGQAE